MRCVCSTVAGSFLIAFVQTISRVLTGPSGCDGPHQARKYGRERTPEEGGFASVPARWLRDWFERCEQLDEKDDTGRAPRRTGVRGELVRKGTPTALFG